MTTDSAYGLMHKATLHKLVIDLSNMRKERDRYKAACELADRYFRREDERDQGEGGAGFYHDVRRALRAAATEEPK